MRAAAAFLFCFLAVGAANATPQGDRMAYDATLKCAVANGLAELDEKGAGHTVKAADYEAKTHRSFDLAVTFGHKIGLSNSQIQHDLDAAKDTELPHMMKDQSYYLKAVATCKGLGLM